MGVDEKHGVWWVAEVLAEIDRRIGAGWMSFNHYGEKLYDCPTASLDLKPGW